MGHHNKYRLNRSIHLAGDCSILECFARSPGRLSQSNIQKITSIPKSTLSRLLHTLTGLNYLKYDSETKKYSLHPKILKLGFSALQDSEAQEIARPYLEKLSRDFKSLEKGEKMAKHRLGVDIGGTFTDFALVDDASGRLSVNKRLTTPHDPSEAIMKGLKALLNKEGLQASQIDVFVQGTTLATNALIERKGAKTGLITTEGFRDVLEMRRETRYDLYDLFIELPEPVVPRNLRVGVRERVNKDAKIVTQLDRSQLIRVIDELIEQGIESVAVCFLNSYANSHNEKLAGEIIAKRAPSLSVSLSSEVAGAIREDERFSTTTINAYVRPLSEKYLTNLSKKMAAAGFNGVLFTMLSNGGLTTLENAKKFPVRLIESGPAGGTMAAVFYSNLLNSGNLVAFDMGGTTAKISMVQDGKPATTSTFEAARLRRFIKGSGLPLMISAIDMIEIGAGGGSIGWVDPLGLLRVGPESSGADPGPACYGLGGEKTPPLPMLLSFSVILIRITF